MNIVQLLFSVVRGWLDWFLGGQDDLLLVLISLSLVDYITDVMRAIADKKLSSTASFVSIFRKITVYLLVGVSHLLDAYVLGQIGILRSVVILFYLSNEGMSILDNAAYLGLTVPRPIQNALIWLRNRAEKDGDEK